MNYWKEDEIELLAVFIEAGYTHKEIANELGRTESSIRSKASILGIKNKYNKLKTHEQYVLELAESGANMKVLEPYINTDTPILHECNECGAQYSCRPSDKLAGKSCNFCCHKNNRGGVDPNEPATVYLVDFYEINVIKPGVTAQTTKKRNDSQGQKYEIIFERHFELGSDAMLLEDKWLGNTKHLQINTGLLRSGNTETFRDIEYYGNK